VHPAVPSILATMKKKKENKVQEFHKEIQNTKTGD
jgi:hypothetical protein